jgi:DNA-binding transcriptional MerR regulator
MVTIPSPDVPPVPITFGTSDVSRLTHIPGQTLHAWARAHILRPEIMEARGRGSRRVYSFSDLCILQCLRELSLDGMLASQLKAMSRFLGNCRPLSQIAEDVWLIIDSREVRMVGEHGLLEALRNTGHHARVLYWSRGVNLMWERVHATDEEKQ